MQEKRVTQRDIAKVCGVSVQAVSLALNRKPGVSPALAERILSTAAEMGYRPDPGLSSLVRYRHNLQPDRVGNVMAFVHGMRRTWPEGSFLYQVYEGVKDAAALYGYKLEPFALSDQMSLKRLIRILIHRGVRAVVFSRLPMPDFQKLDQVDFDQFAAVGFGWMWHGTGLPMVTTFRYANMSLAMKELHRQGIRRIALAITKLQSQVDHGQYLGSFMSFPNQSDSSMFFIYERGGEELYFEWLEREQPEAVLIAGNELGEITQRYIKRYQKNIHMVYLDISMQGPQAQGIDDQAYAIGHKTAELVHSRAVASLYGLTDPPLEILIAGKWVPGPRPAGSESVEAEG